MTYHLGLTGSIGTGKSTTAQMFVDLGCAHWDADAAVHRIYGANGAAVAPLQAAFPGVVVDGAVSRPALRAYLGENPNAFRQLEAIVHPLVSQDRDAFRAACTADIAIYDIPLLFENGTEAQMDGVAVTSVDPDTQRTRVLARGTMDAVQFEQIKARQMPDAEKRARADFIIETDTLEHAQAQVAAIVDQIRQGQRDA